jgi:predicted transglutaminase-like cysteine proteinase
MAATLSTLGLPSANAWAESSMLTGSLTSQPIGHYEFCKLNYGECSIRLDDRGPEHMTEALWGLVDSVNASVNDSVKPMNDQEIFGKEEVWAYPDHGVGDCEDYVLEKRRRLHEAGITFSNLLVTVVRKPDGEGHAVLTVRTDEGDFILDNLTNAVKDWTKTGYHFLKRQASTHTGRWVSIREESPTMVGAVE